MDLNSIPELSKIEETVKYLTQKGVQASKDM